jgi:hypothetical protein
MVREAFPSLIYGHPRTYIVASVDDEGRLDLDPPPDAPELPALRAVEQWAVGVLDPETGAEVVVHFRDANPARPIVVGARGGPGAATPAPPAIPLGRVVRWGDIGTGAAAGSAMPLTPHVTNPGVSRLKA